MKIVSGKENRDGEIRTQLVGESREGETAKEAVWRIACDFLKCEPKKFQWNEKYTGIGQYPDFTERLPALWCGSRIFMINTQWNSEKREYELA